MGQHRHLVSGQSGVNGGGLVGEEDLLVSCSLETYRNTVEERDALQGARGEICLYFVLYFPD